MIATVCYIIFAMGKVARTNVLVSQTHDGRTDVYVILYSVQ